VFASASMLLQIFALIGYASICVFVLLLLPGSVLGKLPKPVRSARAALLGYFRRWRQLSTEGPFYRLAIWSGRKLFKGKLSSQSQAPDVRLKPTGCTEAQVTLGPNLPYNPFHEENYVISWCRASGKDSAWREKTFASDSELEKVSGKLRTHLSNLPEHADLKLRACAVNAWGRSAWSKEFELQTLAKPTEEGGFTGPLGPAYGAKETYTWTQTRTEVFVKIPVGAEVRARDIKFKCTGPRLEVHLDGSEVLVGSLWKRVKPDEVFWTIEDKDAKYGRHLSVQLVKAEVLEKWPCLIDAIGHPRIDARLIRFFTGELEGIKDLSALAG